MAFNETQSNLSEQFITGEIKIGLPWRLFIFSLIIFILSLFIYLGLHFGYINYLESEIRGVDEKLDKLSQQINTEEQLSFVNFYSQIVNLKTILENHYFGSNIFKFLEKNTISAVYFNELETKVSDFSAKLRGVSVNFDALGQQMAIFEKLPEVKGVILNDVTIIGNNVNFTALLNFDPNFLKKQSN